MTKPRLVAAVAVAVLVVGLLLAQAPTGGGALEWEMFKSEHLVWTTDADTENRIPESRWSVFVYNKRTGKIYRYFNSCSSGTIELENGCFALVPISEDGRSGFWRTPEPTSRGPGSSPE